LLKIPSPEASLASPGKAPQSSGATFTALQKYSLILQEAFEITKEKKKERKGEPDYS